MTMINDIFSFLSQEFTANIDYNKLYQRSLNINNARVINIQPEDKLWFSIENGTVFALPLFGDYSGPFFVHFQQLNNHSYSGKKLFFFCYSFKYFLLKKQILN